MLRHQHPNQGFDSDTLISTLDGNFEIKNLYNKNNILAWTYNYEQHLYELKKILIKKNKVQLPMFKIILEDNTYLMCSSKKVHSIDNLVRGFEKSSTDYINHYPLPMKIKKIIPLRNRVDSYMILEPDNNNCAVIPISSSNPQRGIIISI